MDINKYIGQMICKFREQKNITQKELAEYLNTTPQTISRYEIGDRKANQDILFKLANYFNVSINDFFPPTKETKNIEDLKEYNVLFDKYKDLSEDDKELINNIIDTRTKQIDKELDKS